MKIFGLKDFSNYVLQCIVILHYKISMKNQNHTDAKWDVQLRKGTLELVILAALNDRKMYGLELLNALHRYDSMGITEGTLYPLMDRLGREGLIDGEWQQEGKQRPRKYYYLTGLGQERLKIMTVRWRKSVADIELLLANSQPTVTG